VISDPHIFDASTSTPGPAAAAGLARGLKLLAESRQILQEAVGAIARENPAFVLVPGDLTRDGERSSHELAVSLLARLREAGIPVYVVPGNHDVLNPKAARFLEEAEEPVESVTPEAFAALYAGFGYDGALSREPGTLSYAAEPVPGLRLLALDTCRYRENGNVPIPAGRLAPSTRAWAEGVLRDARSAGAEVIAMLHHGIMEHFRGEKTWFGQYVVEDFDAVSALLARGGVRVAFTGHGHAQDITLRSFPSRGDFIFDVETGSLGSWPDPWRIVEVDGAGRMRVRSRFVTSIPDHPADFPGDSEGRLREGLFAIAGSLFERLQVTGESGRILAGQLADAMKPFFRGDERAARTDFFLEGVGPWGAAVAGLARQTLRDLQTDLSPPDNDVMLDLADGSWRGP